MFVFPITHRYLTKHSGTLAIARWQLHTEGIYNRGEWADATFYKLNDIVKYGNDQYRVVVAHTSDATFASANFISYVNGLKFEDSWDTNTEYQQGDIVTYGGYSYVALAHPLAST